MELSRVDCIYLLVTGVRAYEMNIINVMINNDIDFRSKLTLTVCFERELMKITHTMEVLENRKFEENT